MRKRSARLRSSLAAYRSLAAVGARTIVVYRANYLMSMVGVLVQVFLLTTVWKAVYAGHGEVDGVDLATMTAYVTVISVQNWLVTASSSSLLPARVRDGKVAFDLCRPVGLIAQVSCGQLGQTAAMLPFAAIALPLAALVGGIRPPAGIGAGVAYAASLVLALVIAMLASAIIGMVAFWTFEVRGLQFIYRSVSTFLTGALVPLWFMPDWLRTATELLPFQAIGFTPVAVYLGRFSGPELAQALGVQVGWILVLFLACFAIWRRALHRVVIQGG